MLMLYFYALVSIQQKLKLSTQEVPYRKCTQILTNATRYFTLIRYRWFIFFNNNRGLLLLLHAFCMHA